MVQKQSTTFLSIGKLMKNKKYPLYKSAEYFNTPQLRQRWWDSLD